MALFSAFNNKQQKDSLTPEQVFKISVTLTLFVNGDFLDSVKNKRDPNFNTFLPLVVPFFRFSNDSKIEMDGFDEIIHETTRYIDKNKIFSDSSFNIDALNTFLKMLHLF